MEEEAEGNNDPRFIIGIPEVQSSSPEAVLLPSLTESDVSLDKRRMAACCLSAEL